MSLLECPGCQAEVTADTVDCPECGRPQQLVDAAPYEVSPAARRANRRGMQLKCGVLFVTGLVGLGWFLLSPPDPGATGVMPDPLLLLAGFMGLLFAGTGLLGFLPASLGVWDRSGEP
ncbi:MAG: hypothetical protein ACYTGX_13855 [Planctomycetota bacterium]|jgi:hypothetical protein